MGAWPSKVYISIFVWRHECVTDNFVQYVLCLMDIAMWSENWGPEANTTYNIAMLLPLFNLLTLELHHLNFKSSKTYLKSFFLLQKGKLCPKNEIWVNLLLEPMKTSIKMTKCIKCGHKNICMISTYHGPILFYEKS